MFLGIFLTANRKKMVKKRKTGLLKSEQQKDVTVIYYSLPQLRHLVAKVYCHRNAGHTQCR